MNIKRISLSLAGMVVAGVAAIAMSASPYVGQEGRAIKSLSAAEEADLLAGKGMGFAKAAELNGYPGPSHVLELSSQLQLSQEQIATTQRIFERMEAEAKDFGARLVSAERELDELFQRRTVTPELLAASVRDISVLQAKVREAHLRAHIEQTRVLSEDQVARYAHLRGYSGDGAGGTHGHHGHHQ